MLEIDGAGLAIEWMRMQFASAVERNWKASIRQLADSYTRKRDGAGGPSRAEVDFGSTLATLERGDPEAVRAASDRETPGRSNHGSDSVPRISETQPSPLRVGFARAPDLAVAG